MRLTKPYVLAIASCLSPGCWPSEEPLDDEAKEQIAASAALPEEADLSLQDGAAPTPALRIDDPSTTIDWALAAHPFTLESQRVDSAVTDGDGLVVAGSRAGRTTIFRLTPDGAGLTANPAGGRDAGPLGPGLVALSRAHRHGPALAAWTDFDGAAWVMKVDAQLATAAPTRIHDPTERRAIGNAVVAPSVDGALLCLGVADAPLRCATVTAEGVLGSDGFWDVGKTKGLRAEALIESPGGWLLVASTCRAKGDDACRKRDLVALRLGHDGVPPKKRPTLPLPELEVARDGLLIVPDETGFVLIGRRSSAGAASAWRVTDQNVRELDGKWSKVLGGLQGDDALALVEAGPLAMEKGFPVVRLRARPLVDGERQEPKRWPAAVDTLVPSGVDQQVLSSEGLVVFVPPIQKGVARGVAMRLAK